uniref:Uncharacterized protein n=1 Tax=Anguilla anguilla TaxID=7936 RepID=A0A0E9QU86_ANGAN
MNYLGTISAYFLVSVQID